VSIRIGVVVALHWEAQCLQQLTLKPNTQLYWQLTGMGQQAAAIGAYQLIQKNVDLLVSFGCAAGLQPGLATGTPLLPKQVVTANGDVMHCDQHWQQRFSSELSKTCDAQLTETTMVLSSIADKAALASNSMAVAADMESAAILEVAMQNKVAALVTRTVLDDADQALPMGLTDCCDNFAQPKPWKMASWLARKPRRIAAIYQLAAAQRQARITLTAIARILEKMV